MNLEKLKVRLSGQNFTFWLLTSCGQDSLSHFFLSSINKRFGRPKGQMNPGVQTVEGKALYLSVRLLFLLDGQFWKACSCQISPMANVTTGLPRWC